MRDIPLTTHLQIRLIGTGGEVDGYMELVTGVLVMSGVLRGMVQSKRHLPNGQVAIYLDLIVARPPLGNLGEHDLPEYKGKQP